MASGETLKEWVPQSNEPPAANFATPDRRNGHPVLDFALTEIGIFSGVMPRNYAGTTGVTVNLHVALSSATTNDIEFEVSFERIGDSQQDLDADGFAAANNTAEVTVPGTSGHVDIIPVTFTDGADMDSVAVGEGFRLKVERIAVSGTDAAGDAELRFVEIKET